MNFYSGAYFCTQSHWDGGFYHANNCVAIISYDKAYGKEDFNKLIVKHGDTKRLTNPVMEWLKENVKDTSKGEKGWCVGSDEYNKLDCLTFSLFFYRRKDALNFIRTWSIYKKPTEMYNQNTNVLKKLDLETMKLKVVER